MCTPNKIIIIINVHFDECPKDVPKFVLMIKLTTKKVDPWLGCHGYSYYLALLITSVASWHLVGTNPMKYQLTSFFEQKKKKKFFSQNKARRLSLAPEMCLHSTETSSGCSLPNMADVLKGLGKVKLRSVERYGTNFVKLLKEAHALCYLT